MAFQSTKGVIRWKLHLASPVSRVYRALSTDDGRASFWAESALEKDGKITFRFIDYPDHTSAILLKEQYHAFALEYFGSKVHFTLADDGSGGTDLTLDATDVDEAIRTEMTAGWAIAHLGSMALWMGGAAALLPILADVDFGNQTEALGSYISMRSVAWNVIGWGGIGTVCTGIALAAFSSWGFFRYRWVTVKLVVAPALVLFGMFFIERRILLNVAALEDGGSSGLLTTHKQVEIGLAFLLLAFAFVVGRSVVKPWTRSLREAAPRASQDRG